MPKGSILIVDDDRDIVEILVSCFGTIEGIIILTAGNGKEALDVIAQHPDICLILSDIMMPEMTGIELFERLNHDGINIQFVFTSACCGPAQGGVIRENNIIFFQKPWDIIKMIEVIMELIANKC